MIKLNMDILVDQIEIDESIIKKINNITSYNFYYEDNRPHKTLRLPFFEQDDEDINSIEVREYLKKIMIPYVNKFADKIGKKIDEIFPRPKILLSVLEEGQAMEPHKDRENSFVAMLYLSKDCFGGNLFFTESKSLIETNYGTIVVFSSELEHGVTQLESGNKYSICIGHFWQ